MNYKRKRVRAGISAYTMSKELGISYEKYLKVEKKSIPLEGEYLNKYYNALKNAKEIKFNYKQRMHEIREFIKEDKLRDLMAKRGYNGLSLAKTLGYDPSVISQVLNNKYANDEVVEYIYDYLQNPVNANVEGIPKEEPAEDDSEKLVAKLKKIKKQQKLFNRDLAQAIGMSESHFAKIIGGYREMTPKMLELVSDFVERVENGQISIESSRKNAPTLKETAEILDMEPIVEEEPVTKEIEEDNTNTSDAIETTENEAENNELDELKAVNHDLAEEFCRLVRENRKLHEDLVNAKHQIKMYEKLIERL